MFTAQFAQGVLMPAAMGQPPEVVGPIRWMAHLVLHQPATFNSGVALIQIGIGCGLFWPRTVRWAALVSVGWALIVWYFGEGLGGLVGGSSAMLIGAPGAALLYAVLALAALPGRESKPDDRPAQWLIYVWAGVWVIGAALQLLGTENSTEAIWSVVQANAMSAPAGLSWIDHQVARALVVLYSHGMPVSFSLAVDQAAIGLGALMANRFRSWAVGAGIGLSLFYWAVGQNLGDTWTSLATDLNTGPLIVLLGMAVLSSRPAPDVWVVPAQPKLQRGF